MKRTLSLLIAFAILVTATVPAFAQTNPPPGGYTPPTMPQCNHAAYTIPTPKLGGNQTPVVAASLPVTVQSANIDRTTSAISFEVWRVDSKPDDFTWAITFVGYTITPAAQGICATPGDIPDIIFDPDQPNPALAGPNFYPACNEVMTQMNDSLWDSGFGHLLAPGACAIFLYSTMRMACVTLAPALEAWLMSQSEYYSRQREAFPAMAYRSASVQISAKIATLCAAY